MPNTETREQLCLSSPEEKILLDAVRAYSDENVKLKSELAFLVGLASPEMLRKLEERRVMLKHEEQQNRS